MMVDCQLEHQSHHHQQHIQNRPNFEAGKTLKFLEGREALQRHVERLESWTTVNDMERQVLILHVWRGNPACMHKAGNKWMDSSPTERNPEAWVDGKLNMSQQKGSAVCWGAFAFEHSIISCSRKVIVLLCNALMGPQPGPVCSFGCLCIRRTLNC